MLNRNQIEALLKPIKPTRVFELQGQKHVPAYDVAAHLTRVFGFGGWDKEILSLSVVSEREVTLNNQKPGWAVTYSCTLRLTVKDNAGQEVARWEDGSCGTSTQPQFGEAHDMAMKSAISYALKRCAAFGLGDQFGLSLYNKGMTKGLVGMTLVMPEGQTDESDIQKDVPDAESIGNDEFQESIFEAEEGPQGTTRREPPQNAQNRPTDPVETKSDDPRVSAILRAAEFDSSNSFLVSLATQWSQRGSLTETQLDKGCSAATKVLELAG